MSTQVMNRGTAIVGFVLSFVTGAGFMYAVDKRGSDTATATADKGGGSAGSGAAWNMKDGGAIGVTGTPAFIVQTSSKAKQLVGAQPADAFFKAIESLK